MGYVVELRRRPLVTPGSNMKMIEKAAAAKTPGEKESAGCAHDLQAIIETAKGLAKRKGANKRSRGYQCW